jgi:BirA family biotin operon repressor/biotin-[acetyl-CoA-carboxylase] ligase
VAVCEAVRELTGLPAGIKWPNDLQIGGRKFVGILTEMEAEIDRVAFVIVGIGVNVNLEREEMDPAFRESATSLALEGATVRRADLARAILARLEEVYSQLIAGRFNRVLDRWRALSVTLGAAVRVLNVDGKRLMEGTAEDVDAEGALLVRDAAGELHRVVSGEVSIRPQ